VIEVRRALLSAYTKTGIEDLASALVEVGAEILSTGGTYNYLVERGIPVRSLEDWAGLPSMFGGRVKTLHPRVHGGILFRRGNAEDEKELVAQGIEPIDLVAVHLYPFEDAVQHDPNDIDGAIEMIDVGGPTMLRAAAKNHQAVAVICDPVDYSAVAQALREGKGRLSADLLRGLAAKVFRTTAKYDAAIAAYLGGVESRRQPETATAPMDETFVRGAPLLWRLRYGENPSQRGSFYGPAHGFPGGLAKLQGKEISFNNLQDLDAAVALARVLPQPGCAIIKHATPCGAGVGSDAADAYRKARDTDALSAFGGIVAFNVAVDAEAATELKDLFLEVVAAPRFEGPAREILQSKKNLILLEGSAVADPGGSPPGARLAYRDLGEGILVQDPMPDRLGENGWRVVTRRAPTDPESRALLFAWKIVRSVRSNGIVLAREDRTVGIGGGQTSRIDSLVIALHKAGRAGQATTGSVMASDAFFPFADCIEEAAKAGVVAVIQPGGSKRDGDSVEAADRHGMAMVVNDARCFRHG
jgi:phosphoribosylaminoimidazolecarboxamide formyltransferase/IMP cyclohydrolase